MDKIFLDRFYNKIDKDGPVIKDNVVWSDIIGSKCWVWTDKPSHYGYGQYGEFINGKWKTWKSHRLSWIIHNGQISSDKIKVCHKCDNTMCVNPNHLFLGTQNDNVQDAVRKGRNSCRPTFGNDNPNTKIRDEQIETLRKELLSGVPIIDLAKKYGVTKTAIFWRRNKLGIKKPNQ